MDLSWYSGRRVLVTGHTGFKGAWLCRVLAGAGARVTGYALPAEGEENLFTLAGVEKLVDHHTGDVRDLDSLQRVYRAAAPEVVFHLAAQPLVSRGYADPAGTYATNVMGTVNLLECVRLAGAAASVVNVTTDKVYQNNEWPWGYRETDRLDGHDPYANSKSCSELVSASYRRSFLAQQGVALSTVRAGNVIGGGDFAENRILPDCFRAARAGQTVQLRNPAATRPYQHVLEPLCAYLLLARLQAEAPELAGAYNIGPGQAGCATTQQLVQLFCAAWGGGQGWQAQPVENAPHEAGLLKLDSALATQKLGWQPRWSLETAVEQSVAWYRAYADGAAMDAVTGAQIEEYLQMEANG